MTELVADFILKRLRQWGIEQVYAYPGDGINGLVAAFGRADNHPQFIQTRHEEMAAFAAVGDAKFSGRVAVCMATSGPGAIHLLNGLYDAKLDHVPVVAIVGQTARSAVGGAYQQEVDLKSLFKDVASDYLVEVNVATQLPNAIDRAIRTAVARRSPTAVIIPADLQEEPHEAPGHEFKHVPSSEPHDSAPVLIPDEAAIQRAADIINAGERVAILIGQGARGASTQLKRVADITGAGSPRRCSARMCSPTICHSSLALSDFSARDPAMNSCAIATPCSSSDRTSRTANSCPSTGRRARFRSTSTAQR